MTLKTLAAAALLIGTGLAPANAAVTLAGNIQVPGGALDTLGNSPTDNRLSMGSDLFYDRATNLYYGITDRGPGGGVYDFAPRVNVFSLNVNPADAAISNFTMVDTVVFKGADSQPLNGIAPNLLPGGNSGVLGKSFDSEGFAKLPNGNFLVSDEYGPSIYEFNSTGSFVKAYTQPTNVLPTTGGLPDFSGTSVTAGRQDNRGYEGITISPDGKTAYAVLQDPLVNEGGVNSRNLRIVSFSTETGQSTGQFIYQLESVADLNAVRPAGSNAFGTTAQGRNIGVSSITALGDGKFLIIERDNRGWGITDPNATSPTAAPTEKRVYLIDINAATNVGSGALPASYTPVSKTLFLDIAAALRQAGLPIPEKLEGLTLGPLLSGGGIALILATDNDFSTTQIGAQLVQSDVCSSRVGAGQTSTQVAYGAACPAGQFLIPSNIYSFAVTGSDFAALVPEPSTWAMMIAGFGMVGGALRVRRRTVNFARG